MALSGHRFACGALLLSGAVALIGCGGGGGGGGGGSSLNLNGGPAALSEPSIGSAAAAWISSEYLAGGGLAYIGAATGYSARVGGLPGGSGVRIGIIDSGIRLNHQDLIVAQNFVIAAGEPGPTADDHGTHVAGIAGGQRNGYATHGVAYNASIVGLQANAPVTNFLSPNTFTFEDLAFAVGSAAGLSKSYNGAPRLTQPAAESDIVNMSLGGGSTAGFILESMRDAAAQRKIMVIATGNDSNAQPDFPARHVVDGLVDGYGIAVGALDPTDSSSTPAASFSNACGVTANRCLFAPGVGIWSPTAGSTIEFGRFSGTSMATPHVAGAAATLMAAFPTKTPTEIVDRLLSTATDLGAAGTDSIYGRGALNLGAAMNPVGFAAIPGSGETVELDGTGVSLPASFGMPAGMEVLESVLVYDEQDFPFYADLSGSIQVESRPSALESFLQANEPEMVTLDSGPDSAWSYSLAAADPGEIAAGERALSGGRQDTREAGLVEGWRVGFDGGAGLSFTAASQPSFAGATAAHLLAGQATDLALDSSLMLAPFSSLAGSGAGAGAGFALGGGFSMTAGAYGGDGLDGESRASTAFVGINREIGQTGGLISLTGGILSEEDRFLGSSFTGGLGSGLSADTRFLELGLTLPVTARFSLFATASQGWSRIDGGRNGFDAHWSTARSSAYALGARMNEVFGDDRLTLTVGQPHRVESARASLSVPVGETADGAIVRSPGTLDFGAGGRETVVQAVYAKSLLAGAAEISGGLFGRFEPDHVAGAEPEFGAAIKFRLSF